MPADERRGLLALTREPVDRRERTRWLLALVVLAVIAIALRLHALEVGLLSDDYMQHAMIAGIYPGDHRYAPFDLYAFIRGDTLTDYIEKGSAPWFSGEGFHGTVMRPLASALLWLDHTVAPGKIRLWHAHSLAWLGFAVIGFGLCARRLLPRWPAALAVVLFVSDGGFVSPLGWLANRCVLICAAFGLLAIWVHLEWRRPEPATPLWLRRHGPLVELALLALALAAGEYGLGIIAYVFAWELVVGGRELSAPADAWTTRARALVPAATAASTYLLLHTLLGYGTSSADVYADPIHAPLDWLEWLRFRFPKLATGALWGIPAETISVFQHPGAHWWQERWPAHNAYEAHFSHMRLGLLGLGLVAIAMALARAGASPDERRTVGALLLGAGLGLLPVSVAPSHSRLLVVAQLGACVTAATLAFACARLLATKELRKRLRGVALLPIVGAMLVLNSYADLRWSDRYMHHLDGVAEADVLAFTEGDLFAQELAGRDVVVLNGPSQAVGMYGHYVLHSMGKPVPATWRALALGGEHAMFAYRSRADTLELTAIQGAWLETPGELFFRRSDDPLPKGAKLHYPSLDVEILEANAEGRPTRIRFRFADDLDDPRFLFLTSTQSGLRRWQVPALKRSTVVPLPRLPYPEDLVTASQ